MADLEKIIQFIMENDAFYSEINLKALGEQQLILIKTLIELEKNNKKDELKKSPQNE